MPGKCGGKHMFARVAPTWPFRDLRPDMQGGRCSARRSSTTPYSTAASRNSGPAGPPTAATVVTGVLAEVTPRAIVIARSDGEQFLALSPSTVTWLGAKVSPSALRAGDPVIVRRRTHRLVSGDGVAADGGRAAQSPSASVAERIWARIGRVAGEILQVRGRELLVDTGQHGREPDRVVIAEASLRHVQVRFPRLTPGYLIDVIGTRRGDGYLLAVTPATAQPPYLAAHPPAPPPTGAHSGGPISGAAVWHEPGDERADLLGVGYAALDPETEGGPLAQARPATSTSPARGCRTCRSAARSGSATSAPTGPRCCRSPAAAPAPGSSATGA